MASGNEPVVVTKEKKKSKLCARFLLSQAASLDGAMSRVRSAEDDGGASTVDAAESSSGGSSGSRMRRLLFRRSRSEDRTRNVRVIAKPVEPQNSLSNDSPPVDDATEDGATATVAPPALAVVSASTLDLTPRSPPPPYDVSPHNRETNRSSVSNASPPTYDEAMAQNESLERVRPVSTLTWTNHDLTRTTTAEFCSCIECQVRYLTLDEEEQEDSCGDAVFPMETHVLMQEVLADGMAFCILM